MEVAEEKDPLLNLPPKRGEKERGDLQMKKFLAVILLLAFLVLVFVGVKKGKHNETQGIASVICLSCMGFR